MFLVLTPCLYCNVSDSWMLPNRWHRAAIGAAGMYVELVLASICTFIWWFTEPGPLNYICLNVMFISSVSTMMFNANPLLRYDGYYILSDILEIPNLRQKASTILNRKLGKWCLGLEEPEDPFLPQAASVAVRDVHGGVGHLSLGRGAFDSVFPEQGVRAVRAEDPRPDHRAGRDLRPVDSAVVERVQVLQSAGEVGKSETLSNVRHHRDPHCGEIAASALFRCRRTCIARWKCRPDKPSRCTWKSTAFWTRFWSSQAIR